MDIILYFIDVFIHLDQYLPMIIQSFGVWIYVLVFVVIFCETGLVVTPVLPGDSLLFALGTLAALGALHIEALLILLCIAAVAGDTVNMPSAITSVRRFFITKKAGSLKRNT